MIFRVANGMRCSLEYLTSIIWTRSPNNGSKKRARANISLLMHWWPVQLSRSRSNNTEEVPDRKKTVRAKLNVLTVNSPLRHTFRTKSSRLASVPVAARGKRFTQNRRCAGDATRVLAGYYDNDGFAPERLATAKTIKTLFHPLSYLNREGSILAGRNRPKQVESLLSILSLKRLISLRLKDLRQNLTRISVVVDDQNPSLIEQ